ncbi:hypothetical protein LTR48_003742 [Friedmanniomyces endolithicus]|uniref:RING-type domain-containing protein n=1 Tax=Rachicladosporium monterosium TaxID=1507873 RepID=A0ABR0L7F0_9PEZI|nr:hypothetical protein LTR48_003742 [Friedmanniomyces endolithicus]KAK5144681.1 hypothetical protein LTR32_003441 [Rachicladosporium monterosium]
MVVGEGGGEERVEVVLGEEWREVDPGCLPRTLEEMRTGRVASEAVVRPVVVEEGREEVGAGQTLEDTLDQMFQEAEGEDAAVRVPAQPGRANARPRRDGPAESTLGVSLVRGGRDAHAGRNNIHAQAMVPAVNRNRDYQLRRIAALRRELHRMRNGIERVMSGLLDLGEAVPEHAEATNRLTALGSTLDEIEPEGELDEYYALLRRQNWSQRPAVESSQTMPNADVGENGMSPEAQAVSSAVSIRGLEPSDGFPQNMLNGVASSRAQELPQPEQETLTQAFAAERELEADALHVLDYLQRFPELLEHVSYTPSDLTRVHACLDTHALTPRDGAVIYTLLTIPAIVWQSGVMSARFQRRRRLGLPVHLAMPTTTLDWMQQTEVMAEAFQMSGEVRQRAHGMTGPERLSMLYRLQAGERSLDDVGKLQQMLRDRTTLRTAIRVHAGSGASTYDRAQAEASALGARQQRQVAARVGDHSRQELNAQRQAARAMAVAAGRTAMQTGPDALLQQMASSNAETQAAYERLRENGWTPTGDTDTERRLRRTMYTPFGTHELASPSDSETEQEDGGEDDEPAGLDAEGVGRPEPRADEELKVNLECRICYTQLAEIACLPCGHLVMCKWCSEQHSPVMAHDRTRPMRATGCPVCRKGVRQKVRVYRA